jgi:glycosyltransferase involved in cell wall biosynthesis
MISVLIPTLNDAQRLTATLSALASAAMDGFVREVIISDQGSTDATLEVAEDAGADVVTTGLADVIAAARQPWLLFLAPGSRPQVGWERAAHAHMRDYPEAAGWFDLAQAAPGLAARFDEVRAALESRFLARPRASQGLLISKQVLGELRIIGAPGAADIARRLGRARLRSLRARALQGGG